MRRKSPARAIAFVGISAATVECGKLALAALPNIEVVTLLIALYGYVFGLLGVACAIVFVSIEPLIYGFGTWVATYFIYWPLVALVFALLGKLRVRGRFLMSGVAVTLTLFFGVLSSLIDVGLLSGFFDNFFYRFGIYYMRGIVFCALQTTCNALLFFFLFDFLSKKLCSVKKSFFQ